MNNAQGNSLANAVVAYCANCDQLETLGPTVAKISSRHVSLEVTPEQYNVVGEVLLLSLEELLGKEVFNEEVKGAVAEVRLDIYFNVTSFFHTTSYCLIV